MPQVVALSLGGLMNIFAVQVKNSAKVMLLSFNRSGVFLDDIMASENDVLDLR